MTARYWTGAHTKHRLRYHLVWIPKYRKRVLKGKISTRLKSLFYEACQVNRWWIDELTILDNHVHLLIQIKPSESIAEVVQRLKGGSSRIIRKEYPGLEDFLWGDSFWADGYFAETVGQVNEQVIKEYIKNQHAVSIES
ncbi:IS200/IS605 family transposase [Candidatus Woesebacteria bacterium]|nr:IS200/IS605 family transposase [Candidatus Woesebacteria bacterium]